MPAVEAKKSVSHLKVLVSLIISLNQAQETDCLFVQKVSKYDQEIPQPHIYVHCRPTHDGVRKTHKTLTVTRHK